MPVFVVARFLRGGVFLSGCIHALADDRQNDLDDLGARIARAKAEHAVGGPSAAVASENKGWAIGIEFVGMVLVATAIGWGIDNYAGLGTKPWAMIIMLVFGFAGGVYRAMETSSQFDADITNDNRK